jgi:Arc/MetJ-type ribon-helix-helix transcriptional regulator
MAAEGTRKVTVELPAELLERAQSATKAGVTETLRAGLRLVAASEAYATLRRMRGTLPPGPSWQELKDDR